MRQSRRTVGVLTVLIVLLGGLVVGAVPAQALTWYAPSCTGFTACDIAGRPSAGYEAVYKQSFWSMYGGHNCTNYAAYRLQQRGIADFITTGHGNATDWGSQAKAKGIAVDTKTPQQGDIAWWSSSKISPLGHVAYVESVDTAAGTFVVSEDNSSSDFDWRTYRLSEVSGFIHTGRSGTFTDGKFISYDGASYVMAGGAPIAVGSWAAFGGTQSTTAVSSTQFSALRALPVDGTLVRGRQNGQVYVIAGGAPLYISAWSAVGGKRASVAVDQTAIDNAGGTGAWAHLRRSPSDGTRVTDQSPQSYAFAGGAPLAIVSLADVSATTTTRIDSAVLSHAGSTTAPWNNIQSRPANGAYIATTAGKVYRTAGGTAVWLSAWSAVGGKHAFTRVSVTTISKAGQTGAWRFLRSTPLDGAVIKTMPSGSYFTSKGGYWYESASASGAVVLGDGTTLPSNVTTAKPAITGTAAVGQTLAVTDGTWAPGAVALTHQWYRGTAAISGATGTKYDVTTADAGAKITVVTTGACSGLASASSTSAAVTIPAQ